MVGKEYNSKVLGQPKRVEPRRALWFCSSHASVTRALAATRTGAVSVTCEDEVVVSSEAAPSVQAGSSLTGQWIVGGGWLDREPTLIRAMIIDAVMLARRHLCIM